MTRALPFPIIPTSHTTIAPAITPLEAIMNPTHARSSEHVLSIRRTVAVVAATVMAALTIMTITSDQPLAIAADDKPAAHSGDEPEVRYALARLRLAELNLERALEANAKSEKAIGDREVQRLRNHIEVARRQVDIACAHPRTAARQATIAAAEAARDNARGDLEAAVAANARTPGTISPVNMERLKTKLELAEIRLEMCQNVMSELSLLAEMQWSIDQLTDEVIDLRHQIDSKGNSDFAK